MKKPKKTALCNNYRILQFKNYRFNANLKINPREKSPAFIEIEYNLYPSNTNMFKVSWSLFCRFLPGLPKPKTNLGLKAEVNARAL